MMTGHPDRLRQVVVITGASRGLGLELARIHAARGDSLVLCARTDETLEAARAELASGGAEVVAHPADLADPAQARGLVSAALDRFGRVDTFIANAGIIVVSPVGRRTPEDLSAALDVIFWGAVHPTLALLPHMRERGRGALVHVSSIGGRVSVPHLLAYSSAKFALTGFSEGLRAELGGTGVSVTTVIPGLMRTGSHVGALFGGDRRREYAWFSLGATTPVLAMDARRAAAKIVRAVDRRRPEVVLGPQTRLLSMAHGVAPSTTVRALSVVARLLPAGAHDDPPAIPGPTELSGTPLARLSARLGAAAVRRHQRARSAGRS